MTEPTPTPVIPTAAKAWIAAVLSALATILFSVAPFLPEAYRPAVFAVAAVLGVIGVPFGVYITPNKPVVSKI